jgi:Transglutaminase-like superfamily
MSNKKVLLKIIYFIFIVCCSLWCSGCKDNRASSCKASVPERYFAINYLAQVTDIPRGSRKLRLWVPVPVNNLHQEIFDLAVKAPCKYQFGNESVHGNRMLFLTLANPPREFSIELNFKVRRREDSSVSGHDSNSRRLALALKANKLIPISAELKAMAARIAGEAGTAREKAKAFYMHVLKEMRYDKSGVGWGRGDFSHACSIRRGNCTDFHAYFIGLCRNAGVPAFFEIGLSLPARKGKGQTGGYHCWAYFWDGQVWVPVDISEADKHPEKAGYFFGNHDPDRVALSWGRDLRLQPAQKGGELNYFVYPYAEVDGSRHEQVSKKSFYRDILGLE